MLDRCSPDSAVSEICLLRVLLVRALAAARRPGTPARAPGVTDAANRHRSSWHRGAPGRTRPQHGGEAMPRKGRLSIQQHTSMLITFCGAVLTMASLVRFQHKYFGPGSPGDPLLDALAGMDPDDL